MPGGYAEFKQSPKALTTADQIAPGAIGLNHLSPDLFLEVQSIRQHSHTGTKSRKINIKDLTGFFGINGFYMYSSDSTKRYKVTIDSATGTFVLTES